jgi:hypothetical protein
VEQHQTVERLVKHIEGMYAFPYAEHVTPFNQLLRPSRLESIPEKEDDMIRVKTFGEPLVPFRARKELDELDARVNQFIAENGIMKVVSVSDSTTHDEGSTIGLIRVLVYEE